MLEDNAYRAAEVVELVALAHRGQQEQAYLRLSALADHPSPGVRWTAAAARLGWLWWTGQTRLAGDVAEHALLTVGPDLAGLPSISDFASALSAAAYYDGVDPLPRIDRALAALPPGSSTREQLITNRPRYVRDLASLLPPGIDDPEPMFAHEERLARKNLRRLSARDVERLYLQAADRGRREVLLALHDTGHPPPPRAWVLVWTAQTLAEAGRGPAEVEPLLLRYATSWRGGAWWEALPDTLPLGPRLRGLITPRVQQAMLTGPAG